MKVVVLVVALLAVATHPARAAKRNLDCDDPGRELTRSEAKKCAGKKDEAERLRDVEAKIAALSTKYKESTGGSREPR
jgi:hypothetical protein